MDGILDNISSLKQNFLNDKDVSNFKSSLSEAFPFRGFSENEISMIPSHIKNVIHLYNRNMFYLKIITNVSLNSILYIN